MSQKIKAGNVVNQPRPGSPGGLQSAPNPQNDPIDSPRPLGIVAPWANRPENKSLIDRKTAESITEIALTYIQEQRRKHG